MALPYVYNKRIRNAPIRRRLDRRFLSWVMIAAVTGTAVAAAFVYSARCHFEAVALGYETQSRRDDLERLGERRRQLELERARMLAPEELELRAKRLGLRVPEVSVSEPVSAAAPTAGKPPKKKSSESDARSEVVTP